MGKMNGVILCALLSTSAQAAMFGNSIYCNSIAMTAPDVADIRDGGTSWREFEAWMTEALTVARQNPSSYIKDQADYDFVMRSFKRIFDNPKLSGEQAGKDMLRECMGKTSARMVL